MFRKIATTKPVHVIIIVFGLLLVAGTWTYADNFFQFSQPANEKTNINRNEAIDIADKLFLLSNPESTVRNAELMKVEPGKQLVWIVEYESDGSDGEVHVDASSGMIKFYINYQANKKIPTGRLLSQKEAISQCKEKLKEYNFFVPQVEPSEVILTEKDKQWNIIWPRTLNVYKFHHDFVFATITGDTGEIVGYNNRFFSMEPPSLDVKIDRDRAYKLAEKIVQNNNFKLDTEKASLMIVNPNYRWTKNKIFFSEQKTKLAWVIPFIKTEGQGEIWIDALSGDLLGGEETQ